MRHLVLSGSPREIGLAHGKAWPKEIHAFAEVRKGLLKEAMPSWPAEKIHKLLDAHIEVLKKDSELWEEFNGIAEGAKISHRDLMLLNNHTDLRDFGQSDFDERLLECSCFAFKAGNKIIAGQTWDMHGSAQAFVAHLTIKKAHQTQEIFTLTGCMGLTGVTSNRFGVYINNLRSREVAFGYAWPAVVRKALDASSIDEAKKIIKNHMPSAGRNFMLVDRHNATNLEVTAKQMESIGNLDKGYTFHTNHYLSSLQKTEEASTRSKTTLNRYACLEKIAPEVLKTGGSIENISEKLLNQTKGVLSIPLSATDPHASASCGGLIYDFEAQRGVSFVGLYSDNDHLAI